eukprot:gene36980-48259_t
MKGWKRTISKTYEKSYWFRDGEKPTWHNPTQLKGTIDRLNSDQIADLVSLKKACEDLKGFLPDGVDTIIDWIFSQNVMTIEFSSILSDRLCTGNVTFLCTGNTTFHDRLQQRCRSRVQMELEEDKDDFPFLQYFGLLQSFEQDRQDTLHKLMAPFLEDSPLSPALRRLKAFSTAGNRGAAQLKSLVTVLLQNTALSENAREILVDVGCILSKRSDPSQTFRALKSTISVDKDLEWMFSAESPCLPRGS